MKKQLEPLSLLEATNEREFLNIWYQWSKQNNAKLSYASITRKAGFSSRSYVRDVMTGERRLTLEALPRFIKALGLKGDLKLYFSHLVNFACDPDAANEAKKKDRILRLKNRIRVQFESKSAPRTHQMKTLYEGSFFLEVYAALGSLAQGANLDEISERTGKSKLFCQNALLKMIETDLVFQSKTSDRYFARESHNIFSKLGTEDSFKKNYLTQLELVAHSAKIKFDSEENLFFCSVFSIDPTKMPEFKNELRQLLLRFVDSSENPNGKKIARLVTGLTT